MDEGQELAADFGVDCCTTTEPFHGYIAGFEPVFEYAVNFRLGGGNRGHCAVGGGEESGFEDGLESEDLKV